MNTEARNILQEIGGEHINPQTPTMALNLEDRKLVEIARAMYLEPDLLMKKYFNPPSEMGRME